MHIKSNRSSLIKPSGATRDRIDRRIAKSQKLNVPTRRDFTTTPRQHVKLTLKAAVQGFVWPTVA